MEKKRQKSPQELRLLAGEFRTFAKDATLPDYARSMNRAADELEKQADAVQRVAAYNRRRISN